MSMTVVENFSKYFSFVLEGRGLVWVMSPSLAPRTWACCVCWQVTGMTEGWGEMGSFWPSFLTLGLSRELSGHSNH